MPRKRLPQLLVAVLMILQLLPQAGADDLAREVAPRSGWSGPLQLTNTTNGSWDPSIFVDDSGNIHLAWQDGLGKTSIRYKCVSQAGKVLVNDTVLVNFADSEPPIYLSSRPLSPRLDFQGGQLVMFWNDTENHPSGQTDHDENLRMLRFSSDLGTRRQCWLPVYAIDRLYYGNPLYAFDSSGNIHFAYAGNLEWYGEPDIRYVKTNATGTKLFSKLLARNQTEAGVAVDRWDNVHIVWRNETGNLTYCRLDPNGTETCRMDQIAGAAGNINTFTIVATNMWGGANIYWNEMSGTFLYRILPNGTTLMLRQPGTGVELYFDEYSPLMARATGNGYVNLFGYGHPTFQPSPNFPSYILSAGLDESPGGAEQTIEVVEGLNLVDSGYPELGPPFQPFVKGNMGYVAYSSDRLTWQDPAGIVNIYLKWVGPVVDIAVEDIDFSDSTPLEEDNLTINFSFRNIGNQSSPPSFRVDLFLDGARLCTTQLPQLRPGNATSISINWNATRGVHNFSADIPLEYYDSNISNNHKNESLVVFGRPDISAEGIDWDPPLPLVTDRVNISARMLNAGEIAGTFTYGIELDGSGILTGSARLGPGEGGNFSTWWTPGSPGNYTIRAWVIGTDPYELDISNNSLQRSFRVSPAALLIEILEPSNGSAVRGDLDVRGVVRGRWGNLTLKAETDGGGPADVPLCATGEWRFSWDTRLVKNGNHKIAVRVENGWVNDSATVTVLVDNPVPLTAFSPRGDIEIFENQNATFEAELLWNSTLGASFLWTVNGIEIQTNGTGGRNGTFLLSRTDRTGGILSRLEFWSNFRSAGRYHVNVLVNWSHFGPQNSSFNWNLTVRNVNTAPAILAFSPAGNVTVFPNARVDFNVTAVDAEGDKLTFAWFVDGARCQTAPQSPDFSFLSGSRRGTWNVTVVASDGEFQVSHGWTVNVLPKKQQRTREEDTTPWGLIIVLAAAVPTGMWLLYRWRPKLQG